MQPHPSIAMLLVVGLISGITAGFFGIGGGVIMVPALIYLLGYRHHQATGTSLAVLLPPIGLLAVIEYYRSDNVDLRAAVFIAVAMAFGAWFGAYFANRISGPYLRLAFGGFTVALGISLVVGAMQRLEWI